MVQSLSDSIVREKQMSNINHAINTIRASGMQPHQFKQALQMIGRIKPHQDKEFICATIGGKFFEDYIAAQRAYDGFLLLLSNYSRPERVMLDYKILTSAF